MNACVAWLAGVYPFMYSINISFNAQQLDSSFVCTQSNHSDVYGCWIILIIIKRLQMLMNLISGLIAVVERFRLVANENGGWWAEKNTNALYCKPD